MIWIFNNHKKEMIQFLVPNSWFTLTLFWVAKLAHLPRPKQYCQLSHFVAMNQALFFSQSNGAAKGSAEQLQQASSPAAVRSNIK